MTPLTKAFSQIQRREFEEKELAEKEETYFFIQEHLLQKDSDLYEYLTAAGVREENMAGYVLQQYYQCCTYDEAPRNILD